MKWHRQSRYAGLLLQAILLVAKHCLAENLVLDVDLEKPIAVTSDAFLSLTVDPATVLQNSEYLANIVTSTNMARGLAPAYIRLGGPQSNDYVFERTCSIDSDNAFCETHWILLHEWAQNAGLDVIACVAPRSVGNESQSSRFDNPTTNIAKYISFGDSMDYNINLQVGYECQTRCDLNGENLGRHVANLREILKGYPRYSDSLITGPDVVSYGTTRQQKYIENYLTAADAALSAITWHPKFARACLSNGNITVEHDDIVAEKNELYKTISRVAKGKPLWIAESKPEEHIHRYLGALVWTRRLGNAARLGAQVVMRQPTILHQPTPDYWVSLLHKRLVGPEVLEVRPQSDDGRDDHVYLYAQCTKPSTLYGQGAVTIFGVNFSPNRVSLSLGGLGIATLHAYILSSDSVTDDKLFSSEYVLLNNKPLDLIDEELPDFEPAIIADPDALKLPPASVGFWVLPDAKAKACVDPEVKSVATNRITKRREADLGGREKNENEPSRSDINNRKTQDARRDKRKQKHVENTEPEDRKGDKFLARISRMLRRRLDHAVGSPKSQRSIAIELGKELESSEEETRKDAGNGRHLEEAPIATDSASSEETEDRNRDRQFGKAAKTSSRFRRSVGKSKDTRGESRRGHKGERGTKDSGRSGRGRRRRDLGAIGGRLMIEPVARTRKTWTRAADERRTRNELRREGGALVVPFNPRTVTNKDDSDENNFYGFFRQPAARGFPVSDVYGTVADSSIESIAATDYDYVQDDDDEGDGGGQVCSKEDDEETTQDRVLPEDHHVPNEFFENVKFSKVGGNDGSAARENYGDLWEAESAMATENSTERKSKPPGAPDSTSDHQDSVPDSRIKRSPERENFLTEEMFQEEGDCRRRVIRNSGSTEEEEDSADCSREVATDRRNDEDDSGTREDENTTEEEKATATTKTPNGKSTGSEDRGSLSNVMRIGGKTTADDDVDDDDAATTTPVSRTASELSVNNTDGDDLLVTKRTFFPARSPDARSAIDDGAATALDITTTVSTPDADTAEGRGRRAHVVQRGGTARREENAETVEEKTAESLMSSTAPNDSNPVEYPGEPMKTTTTNKETQRVATGMKTKEDDDKAATRLRNETTTTARGTSRGVSEAIDAKRANMLKKDYDERIARSPEMQSDNKATTGPTNIPRTITDKSSETSGLDKSGMRKALRQNEGTDGTDGTKTEIVAQKKDTDNTKSKSKTTPPTLHRVPLKKSFTRYEKFLIRRAEHIDRRLREILARRDKS